MSTKKLQILDSLIKNADMLDGKHADEFASVSDLEGLATEAFVTNKISEAQLSGGDTEIDLSGYATKDDLSDMVGDSPVASQISTAIGAIDHPVDSVNGKTGEVTLSASDVNALPLSGGTMTGKAYLAGGSGVYSSDTAWTSFGFFGTDNKSRGSLMLTNNNSFHFNQKETGATYAERYKLPDIETGLTGDKWYAILTSKNVVTVAQGGTGAKNATDARTALGITPANIGALPISGGTLTDTLYCQSTAGMIGLAIGTASKPENVSIISVGDGTEFNRFSFRQYGANGNRENFNLPNTTTPEQNVNYSILTSKNPVTVAQGGTGKTTLTSGYALIGNGTNAVTLRAITNNTAKGSLDWTSATGTNLITSNTLAYWNGSFNGTSSNLSILGTITTGVWNGSAIPVAHGGTGATTAAAARTALGITPANIGAAPSSHTHNLSELGDIIVATSTPTSVTNGKWYLVKQG